MIERDKIKNVFEENSISISDEQSEKLYLYYEYLIEWNKKINLTAITEYEDVIRKHFLDSALIMKSNYFSMSKKCKILDLGTGAGFPGIVLAILYPDQLFTLVDSLNKRIEFLHIIKDTLELDNIELYHGRAEDLARQNEFRNGFDFVVSRAVAGLSVLLEYCIPFVKVDGYFISYKGRKYKEEIQMAQIALNELQVDIEAVEEYNIKGEKRYLIIIKNRNITKSKYPRSAGKIKKKPL